MNVCLTDDAVAALPLHQGRAELLEEIMGAPALDDQPVVALPRRRPWLAPVAAAAVVAALAAGSAWWASGTGPDPEPAPPLAATPRTGMFRAVLDAPGWTLDGVYENAGQDTGEIGYRNGDATLKIDWYAASDYADRYESRRHVTDPPSDGTPTDVLGLSGSMWAYADDDHTVIRPVQDGHFLEIRASGLDEQAYLALLGELRLVDADGFDAALPEGFVSNAERQSRIAGMLDEIARYADPLLPVGVSRASITSDQSDPYQLGAEVTSQVACAWVAQFADATRSGDPARAQEAVDVMTTTRQWPVLKQMSDRGDVPEWIWDMADQMAAGQVPLGWRPSCRG